MSSWHIITGEYPPERGGVADYTRQVATGLAAAGDNVHVWCPGEQRSVAHEAGVIVHRTCGRFSLGDLRRMGHALDRYPSPRQLLVQYVPHAFFYRSLNVGLAGWIWSRARWRRDAVHLMVHEPFLAFEGTAAQHAAALVHRAMATMVLDAASVIWVAIPEWERVLRPFALRGAKPFGWLPVPSNVAVARVTPAPRGELPVVGHFGTYGDLITSLLTPVFERLAMRGGCRLLAMGRGSEPYRESLPDAWRHKVTATGELSAEPLSRLLQTCDVLVQPYPDGLSTRRTTAMAALAHGIPLVSNRGSRTEDGLWDEAAVLTPPDVISEAVESLLMDRERRATMACAQRQLYRERFDVRHTTAALRAAARSNQRAELATACESSS